MKALPLTAALVAAAVSLALGSARAADLDYDHVPPPDRFGSAYEDPRYRDLYAPEPPRIYRYEPRPYVAAPPIPPGYVYRERGPDRFADWGGDEDWRYGSGCLPRREIERRLYDSGWHDFHDIEIRRHAARVSARRPNGDVFRLKVDRCNGEVLRADLIDRPSGGPYAWRDEPRHPGRPLY